jgi:hypothetical protein
MLGGRNGTFYVQDARTAVDSLGRHVIAARDFAQEFAIRTVFGMGGAYVDGTMAVAIFFCPKRFRASSSIGFQASSALSRWRRRSS